MNTSTGCFYSAKILKNSYTDPQTLELFHSETALLASIRDPHVVSLIGTSTTNQNQPVLITEYMAGGSLKAKAGRHRRRCVLAQ